MHTSHHVICKTRKISIGITRECTHFTRSITILFLQDARVFNSDFEKSILGMEHHLRHLPKNHSLFIPEGLVELETKEGRCSTKFK